MKTVITFFDKTGKIIGEFQGEYPEKLSEIEGLIILREDGIKHSILLKPFMPFINMFVGKAGKQK